MKVLLLSNQGMVEPFVGNPIMLRYRDALLNDKRIDDVKMLRCNRPFSVAKELRSMAQQVDIIHVHFGGIYALATWLLLLGINKPKFITFHGTDIHAKALRTAKSFSEKLRIKLNQYSSFLSIICFSKCGFVAQEMEKYIPSFLRKILVEKNFIQALGVDYNLFSPMKKIEAQKRLRLMPGKYVLFSDVHNTSVKRRDIAEDIVNRLEGYKLLIMCGVKSDEVPLYINACEFILLTSDQEGSPNIIREALSLNKPVFSVEAGDAVKQLEGLCNSAIISRNPDIAAQQIKNLLMIAYKDNSRETKKSIIDFSECSRSTIQLYVDSVK